MEPPHIDTSKQDPGRRRPWVVGISGASGTPYAASVLRGLLAAGEAVDLIVSRASRLTLLDETGIAFRDAHWRADLREWLARGADGKPAFISLFGTEDKTEFRVALLKALSKGRFQPAMSAGKAVPVLLGGTVFFMFRGNEPILAISLSTAKTSVNFRS